MSLICRRIYRTHLHLLQHYHQSDSKDDCQSTPLMRAFQAGSTETFRDTIRFRELDFNVSDGDLITDILRTPVLVVKCSMFAKRMDDITAFCVLMALCSIRKCSHATGGITSTVPLLPDITISMAE